MNPVRSTIPEPAVAARQMGSRHKGAISRLVRPGFAGLLLSAIVLKFLPLPFLWLGWGWASTLILGAWYLGAGRMRVVLANAAVVPILLAGVETYATLHRPVHAAYSGAYNVSDDVLGFAPVKPTQVRATKLERGKLAYSVTYTIGENGLRISPPAAAATSSILFFGCSFTFGEGVEDDQAMPYQAGLQSGGRYQVYNFGFHGYGPQQMLAAIESGRVGQIVTIRPRYAIYQVLPDHINRVAGKVPYAKHAPRYQLAPDGSLHFRGHFDDGQKPPSRVMSHILGQLDKSASYQMLLDIRPRTNQRDFQLLLATVRRSRDLLAAEYPGIEFHVILWRNFEYEQKTYEELEQGFAAMNIPVHRVEDMLPAYNSDSRKYWLSREDGHPNPLANRLIAADVVRNILSSDTSGLTQR